MKAVAVRTGPRYQSAQALALAPQGSAPGAAVPAHRECRLAQVGGWMKKHRQLRAWAGAAAAVLAVVLFGLVKWRELETQWAKEREEAAAKLAEEKKEREEAQEKADLAKRQDEAREKLKDF